MFSRELVDCVQFGQLLYPELSDGILQIYHDYIDKQSSKGFATMILLQEILIRDIITGQKVEDTEEDSDESEDEERSDSLES